MDKQLALMLFITMKVKKKSMEYYDTSVLQVMERTFLSKQRTLKVCIQHKSVSLRLRSQCFEPVGTL